jgi:glutamate-1-semialdehyde 2,1-aminomutase
MEFSSGSMGQPGPATLVARYGDADSFKAVLDEHGDEVAAVFVEGIMGAGGMRSAPAEFFIELRKAANDAGALFVIDEVITFRLGVGGHQGNLGVSGDLTMLGKLIGGGFAVGAVAASREIMKVMDTKTLKIFHSGTFNANPMTMAAGDVAVRELTAARIEKMAEQGARIAAELSAAAAKLGMPFCVNQCGSLLNVYFSEDAPADIYERTDHQEVADFHLACFNHGVSLASRGMMVLSTVMTDEIVGEAIERISAAMADVAAAR